MCKYGANCDDYNEASEPCQYYEIACPTYWKIKNAAREQRILGQTMLMVM